MVWEWFEWLIQLLSEAENLHNISTNKNSSNASLTADKNEWKTQQRQDVDKTLACTAVFVLFLCICYATSSYFRRQSALAEKLGKFKSQVAIFGRRNNELSKELMQTMSQLALAEQKLMCKDSSMVNIMEMTQLRAELESIRVERSSLLERVSEAKSKSSVELVEGSWEQRARSLELKLRNSESETKAMRLELARKESAPNSIMLRMQTLLDAKNKAVAEVEELQASLHSTNCLLEDTKRDLNFERLKNERLNKSNLELQKKFEQLKKACHCYPIDPSASEEEQWVDMADSKQESNLSFDDTFEEEIASLESLHVTNNCVNDEMKDTLNSKSKEREAILMQSSIHETEEYQNTHAMTIVEEEMQEKEDEEGESSSSDMTDQSMSSINNVANIVDPIERAFDFEAGNLIEESVKTTDEVEKDNNKKFAIDVNTITEEEEDIDDSDEEGVEEEDEDEEEEDEDDDVSSELSSLSPDTFSRSNSNMAVFFASPRPVSGSLAFRRFLECFNRVQTLENRVNGS